MEADPVLGSRPHLVQAWFDLNMDIKPQGEMFDDNGVRVRVVPNEEENYSKWLVLIEFDAQVRDLRESWDADR